MSDENPTPEELARAEAKAKAVAEAQAKADEVNAARSGKGTRVFVGSTRGRATQVISYEGWDNSQPETLPLTLSEFMELRSMNDEKEIVKRLLMGDNDILYAEASDPVAEFVEPTWPEDVQKQFRLVVRNYASACNVSIEDAVALIKPGIVKSQQK